MADVYSDQIRSILTFEGVEGSQYFPDQYGRVATPYNENTFITTERGSMGSGTSLKCRTAGVSPANSFLTLFGGSEFVFEGDFTVEWRQFMATSPGQWHGLGVYLFGRNWVGASSVGMMCSGNGLRSWAYGSERGGSSALLINAWNHLVYQRKNNVLEMYCNGVRFGADTITGTLGNGNIYIGNADGTSAVSATVDQFIDNVIVTKDVARYTHVNGTFTPPTELYVPAYKIIGVVKEAGNTIAGRTVRAYDRATGLLCANTVSDAAGTFVLNLPAAGPYYVVALDGEGGAEYNALIYDKVLAVQPS